MKHSLITPVAGRLNCSNLYRVLLLAVLICTGCRHGPTHSALPDAQTVVLLHGLFRSSDSMDAMQQALINAGYNTCNISYPSTDYGIVTLAEGHVLPAIRECTRGSVDSLAFVTHSMGGIIVRYLSANGMLPAISRVVMLAPPNKGSELVDALGDLTLFEWMNGPAGSQLGTSDTGLVKQLPPVNFELGVIAGDYSFNPLYSNLIPGEDDGKVSVESAKTTGMKDFLVLPVSHTFIMKDEEAIRQTVFFFENGFFDQ